jgi:hypothetical protein
MSIATHFQLKTRGYDSHMSNPECLTDSILVLANEIQLANNTESKSQPKRHLKPKINHEN